MKKKFHNIYEYGLITPGVGLYASTPGALLRIKKFPLAYLQYGNIKVASHPCGRTLSSLKLPL